MDELTCEQVLHRLEIYLDGELAEPEARLIEAHLTDCSECFSRRGFLTRLRALVRERCGQVDELPGGLADRVKAAIRDAGSSR